MNILITGGTDGMGRETARRFAATGARLLLAGRNRGRGERVVGEIADESGNETVTFHQADLSLLSGVRQLTAEVRGSIDRLDIVMHSAGGHFPWRRTVTTEGLEFTFALLTMARWLLTVELMPLLEESDAPRVLLMAGGGTARQIPRLDNLQGERRYSMIGALRRAAPLNDLLTLELQAGFEQVAFYNYGPGLVRTRALMSTLPRHILFSTVGRIVSRKPEEAAGEIVELLTGVNKPGFYTVSLKRNEARIAAGSGRSRFSLTEYLEQAIAGT
jgi:NAD(P)-dependent dehydrogenase (short-subunit alcohol dehydrogenase family)